MTKSITENRDVHVSVMVKPSIVELLEQAKGKRRGQAASKSSVASDILEYFFATHGTDVDRTIRKSTKNGGAS